MLKILAVGAGGFVGAALRYLLSLIPVNEALIFPIKTFAINVIGCIVIGLITVAATKNSSWNPYMLLFMKVGVCGGFTTFSTFALETTDLLKNGHGMTAFVYILLSVLVGVGAIFAVEYFLINNPQPTIVQQDFGKMQIANPWSGWDTLAEAEEAVGFPLGIPETVAGSYVAKSYRTMSGELLESTYYDGDYKVCVRKIKGEGQDCSGDYNTYSKVETVERGGGTITFYIDEQQSRVGKTIISYDGYSWSLYTPDGFRGDSGEHFLEAICVE